MQTIPDKRVRQIEYSRKVVAKGVSSTPLRRTKVLEMGSKFSKNVLPWSDEWMWFA